MDPKHKICKMILKIYFWEKAFDELRSTVSTQVRNQVWSATYTQVRPFTPWSERDGIKVTMVRNHNF